MSMNFPNPSSSEAVISVADLSCSFGDVQALRNVSLQIPQGSVFGLVGENGAGKTTLIKHILGLLRPQSGSVKTLSRDPVTESVEVLKRLGYLSEQRDLAGWMRIDELIRFTRSFYPGWDGDYANALLERFQLRREAVVKTLSQGQLAKTALLIALAYRPELLILDEPSSGLDPIVRREILEAILRTIAEQGRTVFFSSHLLDEIERVCDYVAIMHRGRVAATGQISEIKQRYRLLTVRLPKDTNWQGKEPIVRSTGDEIQLLAEGTNEEFRVRVKELDGEVLDESPATFEEIFNGIAHTAGAE
jgi:ABC-2 type transport system ATP-binding protein